MAEISEEIPLISSGSFISPAVASIGHCLFLIACCQGLRHFADKLIPNRLLRVSLEEFICTLQLCACSFELGVVTEAYGFSGYAVGLFLTSLTYSLTFRHGGTADPSECLWNVCQGNISPLEFLVRSASSLSGALVSYQAARLFWLLQLVPEHGLAFAPPSLCTASLQVSLVMGFLVEAGETLVNRVVQNTEGFNLLTGALADVGITFFGLFVTGGYFNPSLSLAMELGCNGLANQDYLLVYFAGPMIATLIATQLMPVLLPLVQPQPELQENTSLQSRDKLHTD